MDRDLRIRTENVRNIVVEAANAGDEALLEDVVADGELPSDAGDRIVESLERWPRRMLSAGTVGRRPVAVVWMPDRTEAYVPVGHLEFVLGEEPEMIVVDGVVPELTTEAPSARHVAPWESSVTMDRGSKPSTPGDR